MSELDVVLRDAVEDGVRIGVGMCIQLAEKVAAEFPEVSSSDLIAAFRGVSANFTLKEQQ